MTTQSQSQTAARPPVTLHPTAHLDPGAYVRGTHAISLGADVLVHPRAHLVSVHGPLIIDTGAIICEKAVLGGPVPPLPAPTTSTQGPTTAGTPPGEGGHEGEELEDPVKTVIGANVLVQPHVRIHAGATLREASTIETHAVVLKGVVVGDHAKVCAGCYVDRDVGAWEVVMSDGRRRRRRGEATDREARIADGKGQILSEEDMNGNGTFVTERARLRALNLDREATMGILKTAAKAAAAARKK